MIRTPLRPLARILQARDRGENPDAIERENIRVRHEEMRDKSRQLLRDFYRELGDDIPIISVGGIDSAEEAKLRFELGAKLIQLYTGLIYRGPGLVKTIAQSL